METNNLNQTKTNNPELEPKKELPKEMKNKPKPPLIKPKNKLILNTKKNTKKILEFLKEIDLKTDTLEPESLESEEMTTEKEELEPETSEQSKTN